MSMAYASDAAAGSATKLLVCRLCAACEAFKKSQHIMQTHCNRHFVCVSWHASAVAFCIMLLWHSCRPDLSIACIFCSDIDS